MPLPAFSLPSDPQIKITLREATVADLIDFADIDPEHEEEVTTLFLDRMQEENTRRQSKTWTGEDRRFALFWYWLHTTDDCDVAISYDCTHCGGQHVFLQDFRKLAEGYASIDGTAKRTMTVAGTEYQVKPLTGEALESLETMRGLGDKRSDVLLRKVQTTGLCAGLDLENVTAMPVRDYKELAEKVNESLIEMKHGLASEIDDGRVYLILPPVPCLENKEDMTQVRVFFRVDDYLPAL